MIASELPRSALTVRQNALISTKMQFKDVHASYFVTKAVLIVTIQSVNVRLVEIVANLIDKPLTKLISGKERKWPME